ADNDAVLVSIVVPTYNRAKLLARALGSALRQTHRELEVVVVDDGSTDETAAVLGAIDDPRLRVVRHAVNRGVTAARNTGLDHARGEWIGMLDSDDELIETAVGVLAGKAEALSRTHRLGTLMCNCREVPGGRLSGKGLDG